MPLMPGTSQSTVSSNIREFHKGPTYEKTAENHGKGTADKQAVAVAMHEKDKSKGGEDHKAMVAKMHPEHLHKLVKHAMSGKAGPEAQQMAQQAMQGQGGAPAEGGEPPMQGRTNPFSDDQPAQPATPASSMGRGASIFGGGE